MDKTIADNSPATCWPATTAEGLTARKEFGLDRVPLEDAGAPTPGWVANRLSDLTGDLEDAVEAGDLGAIVNGVAAVRRLILALDAWGMCLMHQATTASTADR